MKFLKTFFIVFFGLSTLFSELTKVHYHFTPEPIDVVIPCAAKDRENLLFCIEGIRTYGKNVRRIIVVSKDKLTDRAEWFPESNYPFSKETLATEMFRGNKKKIHKYLSGKGCRIGWIYQQFLKLYAPYVIPGISPNVLIVDADVMFIRPVEFMDAEGAPFFNVTKEYHSPYFRHMARLLPDLKRVYEKHSGVTHHMLFQRPILDDLFSLIREKHGVEPWKALCYTIDPKEGSCLSEYEIYFNFTFLRTDQAKIQVLPFIDVDSFYNIENYKADYTYITSHQRP